MRAQAHGSMIGQRVEGFGESAPVFLAIERHGARHEDADAVARDGFLGVRQKKGGVGVDAEIAARPHLF